MPLSTTLASSMALSSGGPGSKLGDASGTSSTLVVITPFREVRERFAHVYLDSDENLGVAKLYPGGAFRLLDDVYLYLKVTVVLQRAAVDALALLEER